MPGIIQRAKHGPCRQAMTPSMNSPGPALPNQPKPIVGNIQSQGQQIGQQPEPKASATAPSAEGGSSPGNAGE